MYKKIIKYTDYNGTERKEPFYFNLEESDIMRYNFSVDGPNGYQSYLNRLLATQKTTEAYEIFEKFICDSYGVKSDDGKRFIKNQEVLDEFKQSRAYSELLMELISVPGAATEFFNGIMPPALLAQMIDSKDLVGVIVNMKDYNLGNDKNAAKGLFDDFDIDYNQYKYLIETRRSGALVRPYSAMTVTLSNTAAAQG